MTIMLMEMIENMIEMTMVMMMMMVMMVMIMMMVENLNMKYATELLKIM